MRIDAPPLLPAHWSALAPEEHPGDSGTSHWRTLESGAVRTRLVDYAAGFRADHWCPRGHVLFVLEGEISVGLRDGRIFHLGPGSGFILPDDDANPHSATSDRGARVFIVD
jgi:quercetin dioxygenase-like cupin family protein